ncbi:MAG: hypothetical protein E7412_04340 [Ruminococcaceae bacterium]|nr:hypothetical protein [Oscillospiraceae bacterium]
MMSVKEQLYYLIKHVKLGNYDINTFCDMFTNLVNLEMWKEEFSEKETAVFNELNKYTSRFSPFEEDLKLPNVFYDEKEIKKQIDIALKDLEIDIVS